MNFRKIIKQNQLKTKLVMFSFVLLMIFVGLVADVAIGSVSEPSFWNSFFNFLTLKKLPIVTIVLFIISSVSLLIISWKGHKIMMSGSIYKELHHEQDMNFEEKQALNLVEEMAISASLGYVPKTYIMDTDDMNAFAAGWNENNAVVCVTTGLLNKLNRNETQAVIAHEIGHIIHGDSKLTLYVGILANAILTFTNLFAHLFMFGSGRDGSASGKARLFLLILNLILPILTKVLYLYLSRKREYMADATAVRLTGDNQAIISALKKISSDYEEHHTVINYSTGEEYRKASYIFSKGDSVFSTHPSIENRILFLEGNQDRK